MLISQDYKKHKKYFIIKIIFQILNLFLITSCTLNNLQKNNDFYTQNVQNQSKKLLIPKGIHIPDKNDKYDIPYTEEELKKENYSIFPPI